MKSPFFICCDPKAPSSPSWEEWVLLPAFAWRIAVYGETRRNDDVFQRVLLRILHSGDYTITQLAQLTLLSEDLVSTILQSKGLEDSVERLANQQYRAKGRPNSPAKESPEAEPQIGYVFQDAWTGNLFPTFVRGLARQETAETTSTGCQLSFSDESQSYQRPATILDFPPQHAAAPDTTTIIKSLRKFSSEEFRARQEGLKSVIKTRANRELQLPGVVPRMAKLLDRDAQPVLMATPALILENPASDWHFCCPVGSGLSTQLRQRLIQLADSGDTKLRAMVQRLCGRTQHRSIQTWQEWLLENRQLAEQRTIEAFGPRILDFQKVAARMNNFHNAYLQLQSARTEPSSLDIDSVGSEARKTLEATFKEFAKRRPFTGLDVFLPGKDQMEHKKLVLAWAQQMGMAVHDLSEIVIVNKNWLKSVAGDPGRFYSITTVVGALVIQAWSQKEHFLRTDTDNAGRLFFNLRQLIQIGNMSSHDDSHLSDDVKRTTKDEALKLRRLLVEVVHSLLDPEKQIFSSI